MRRVLLIGLGNPGARYEATRHNLGFRVIDLLCRRLQRRLAPTSGEYLFAWAEFGDARIGLAKPATFMNNSGEAVVDALHRHDVSPAELLVICDDFAIPLGSLRLRGSGSDGGHNGLASIIYHLQSDAFPRLRCGIGIEQMPPKEERAAFVLSTFGRDEEPTVSDMIGRAGDVCMAFAAEGIAHAMERCTT